MAIKKISEFESFASPLEQMRFIWANASDQFKDRIPQPTQDNLKTIGLNMSKASYTLEFNEWVDAVVNRIGKIIIDRSDLSNPLAKYKKGKLEWGSDIEHVFVDIIEAQSFEPIATTATDPFPIWPNNVKSLFYRINRRDYYPITIRAEQLRTAFTSSGEGYNSLIDNILAQAYNSNEYDEWLLSKELFSKYIAGTAVPLQPAQVQYAPKPIDETTGKEFYRTLQAAVLALKYPSRGYNPMGVMSRTPRTQLDVLVRADNIPYLNVDVLSAAFNMGKVTDDIRLDDIDNFGDESLNPALANVEAIIFDRNFIQTRDTWVDMVTENIRNPRGLYTNHYSHIWQLYAASLFHSVIIITSEEPTTPGRFASFNISECPMDSIDVKKLVTARGKNVEGNQGGVDLTEEAKKRDSVDPVDLNK